MARLSSPISAAASPSAPDAVPPPIYSIRGCHGPVERTLQQLSVTDNTVLISGDPGVGKDALCKLIHSASSRSAAPFLRIPCFGATPASVAERFKAAAGGTIVLREIHLADPTLQTALLDLIDEHDYTARIITTARPNLHADLQTSSTFNVELFYRISAIHIALRSLRERPDDVVPLARAFLHQHDGELHFPPELEFVFLHYHWPGNIRELQNLVHQFCLTNDPGAVLDRLETPIPAASASLGHSERERILAVLTATAWNRRKAAGLLGLSYKALLHRLKKLGLHEPRPLP